MIRVGMIGLGRIADLHYAGYEHTPDAVLHAVCDPDEATLARRKQEWGVEKGYNDYRSLLEDPDIDAVEIVAPQTIHEPIVIAAAEAGKHTAVQKPMTTSLESAQRMLAAVDRAGVVYKVTDNYPFHPPIQMAKRLIDEGVIGDPITMRMKFVGGLWKDGWEVPNDTWAWRIEEASKGRGIQTFDHGHHMWCTAWYLMGRFERVAAWIDTTLGFIDCPAVIMWKHEGTRYGTCDYTQATDLPIPSKYYSCDEWFEVTGSKGIILVRRCTGNLLDGPAVSVFTREGWQHHDIESDWSLGFRYALQNFIAAVKGEAAPLLIGAEALHILQFAFALRKASDERREVSMAEMEA